MIRHRHNYGANKMSELAKNEFGEEWAAIEVKDAFLQHGTRFESFYCAFCDIPVSPVACYGDEFVKAPHFAKLKRDHAGICPYGKAGLVAYGINRKSTSATYKFEVDLPERLVPIRPVRVGTPPRAKQPSLNYPSDDEIKARVKGSAGTLQITNQYTTSLLRTLAAARRTALSQLFKLPEAKKLADDAKALNNFVFGELAKAPLKLYEEKTNYKNAFHGIGKKPWNGKFIYFGDAKVSQSPTGFLLTAENGPPKEPPLKIRMPVSVHVKCDISHPVNLMEKKTNECLLDGIATDAKVYWFAYGALVLNAAQDGYELRVELPEHIYVSTTKP